ncbi:putative pentatricopeptide repeat-containing protein At3g13770, mitochondrial [Phalaenopsis equestris]|uniref:putative pentatricopeptide repeat-containing protein At3g13770, mitochondrial n=1 Tax=Phalaenopsis equestris TaxID=78828 RepID=UPI0009E189F9|nr:putative pentatricopeptide repeat-containing protein At3g13770, mitochondrial [Phalaenopsis equestris]
MPKNLAGLLSSASTANHATELHGRLITSNSLSHPYFNSLLVSLYARCNLLSSATAVLLLLPSTTAAHACHHVSPAACTAVLSRLSRSPRPADAISLFSLLRHHSRLPHPSPFTFSALLPACRSSFSGSQLHSLALKYGVAHDLFASSALTDMYAKSSDMDSAELVFEETPRQNLVSWNALLVGYVHNHQFHKAISVFSGLFRLSDPSMKPDQVTFSAVLTACANSGELCFGLGAHGLTVKIVMDSLAYVNNSLTNMYSKCGRVEDARKLFDEIPERDAVTWNIMIASFVETEHLAEACRLFMAMRRLGIKPDEASFSTLLHASSNLAQLLFGAEIHCQVVKFGLAENCCITSSLITMYSKCGSLEEAQLTFADTKVRHNVVSWTAMIAALQQYGLGNHVLQLFDEMLEAGLQPDYITFVCVLSACSHTGLVEKGFEYFKSMSQYHKKIPGNEHYACMVDMLGRAGRLDDAKQFIDRMPVKPDASVWGALLGACRNCRNLEFGKEVAYKLFEIEPHNSGNYVLLSNLYATHGKMKEANEVRRLMRINGVKKETSCSWIDVRNKTFVFTVHDQSHDCTQQIYEKLRKLEGLVKEKGYVADTLCAVNDVEEYKEENLWHHSERLALAFGLISLPEGAPIRIKKNVRTCGDCHTIMKHVSGIFQRRIVLRDTNRFHQFVDGSCSCKDYW